MRVFLDACVLYSASRPGSLMERFVLRLLREAECCTNSYALEEARRNLEVHEPDRAGNLAALASRLQVLVTQLLIPEIPLPEKDKPILGGAIAGRCSHLLTSDRRDFGRYYGSVIHGVKVVSPQLMAEELGLEPSEGSRD
jgi:hypothetical protein